MYHGKISNISNHVRIAGIERACIGAPSEESSRADATGKSCIHCKLDVNQVLDYSCMICKLNEACSFVTRLLQVVRYTNTHMYTSRRSTGWPHSLCYIFALHTKPMFFSYHWVRNSDVNSEKIHPDCITSNVWSFKLYIT